MDKPIALWSGPRNVSTALMYSFANRGDCRIIDEPLFGCFLRQTGVWRPSREEALQLMDLEPESIFLDMKDATGKSQVFSKNMANHLEDQDFSVLHGFTNVILTREPSAVLGSYSKQIKLPTSLDLCYNHQLMILEYLKKNHLPFRIVNSDELRNSPEEQLKLLCLYLDIPFTRNMLAWDAGARAEDGVWAKYWYHQVHKSTGFVKSPVEPYTVPEEFSELYQESLGVYNKIISFQHE